MTGTGGHRPDRVLAGKRLRLCNVLFPMWLFYLFPTGVWLILLPANFVVDTLVLRWGMKRLRIADVTGLWRRSILRVWGFGFLSDLLGAGFILGLQLLIDAAGLPWNTFFFPGVTLLSLPGVVLAGFCIYGLNARYAFAGCGLKWEQIRQLSRMLAVFTAPYAMLIPLYG